MSTQPHVISIVHFRDTQGDLPAQLTELGVSVGDFIDLEVICEVVSLTETSEGVPNRLTLAITEVEKLAPEAAPKGE